MRSSPAAPGRSSAARTDEAASPLYVVGARTARAAEARGWRLAAPPAPDAARLAETLRRELPPGASVLYLAGRDRKPALEAALGGFCALEVAEAYVAEARASWRPPEIRALASCAAALHYSRRSAVLAAQAGGNRRRDERVSRLASLLPVGRRRRTAEGDRGSMRRRRRTTRRGRAFCRIEQRFGRISFRWGLPYIGRQFPEGARANG